MNSYRQINNITGWAVFVIATVVYVLTVEPTASFWDCGEFIAVSYKLEVPHPPGAPLFLLAGRLFSLLAGDNVMQVAFWINMLSVLSSSFTILFLFWTITLLGRKVLKVKEGEETLHQKLLLMGSGVIGAMAFTFSDSFWFSAVEAEVYALSSFFTAFVFWAILKWELIEDERKANRWLILTAYMMGLSIGVHLLNLVTIPALAMIFYFKRGLDGTIARITLWGVLAVGLISIFAVNPGFGGFLIIAGIVLLIVYKPGNKALEILITLLISGGIIGAIMIGIIPGLPSIAGSVEIFFVNSLNLPFGSGILFFILIFLGLLVYGIYYSNKKQKVLLNTALLCFAFIMIGYASYATIVIRSNFNPPIDENNPEDIMSFVSYLKREQYGSRPLLHGPYFTSEIKDYKKGAPIYIKGKEGYEKSDYRTDYVYEDNSQTILPRAYSPAANHAQAYREWMNLKENEKPDFADNIGFMLRYQLGHMYFRYFMWNFVGRESDVQGAYSLWPWDVKKDLPETLANNKARNNYWMLPFILGLAGLVYHYKKDKKGFAVTSFLFFFTGIAIILYLNQPPIEPRERDYSYVGSFYAFAIWIGFGVMALANGLNNLLKNKKTAAIVATSICLIVPGIMAAEGWDDHDRSNRYFSVDSARNFLASCAKNAILFTGGDNDTFPLWYVQEVEGFRTDVRVVVLSYFNTDWYIDQMTRRTYESEPFPFSLEKKHYQQGGLNDVIYYVENPNIKEQAISLKQYMRLIKEENKQLQVQVSDWKKANAIPAKFMFLNVNREEVLSKNIIPESKKAYLTDQMVWNMKGRALEKKDLMIMDLIATNNWERPIYFNVTSLQGINLNLNKYVVQEGTAYRLLPVENPNPSTDFVDTEKMYENMMNKFAWRELDNPGTYYTDDYRRAVRSHRSAFSSLANGLIAEGQEDKAREVLLKSLELMPDEVIPYGYGTVQSLPLLLQVDANDKAKEIADVIARRADEELAYYLGKNVFATEVQSNLILVNQLAKTFSLAGEEEHASKYRAIFDKYFDSFNR